MKLQKPIDNQHVVIIVPGIQDRGLSWKPVIETLESHGFAVELVKWSPFFDVLRFLAPIRWIRRWAIRQLEKRIQDVYSYHKQMKTSYIAHSFGSFVLCHLLRREHYLTGTHRIILCGSVLPETFKFPSFMERYEPPVLNEIGMKDYWPLVAKCCTFGYGAIGTYGYGGAPVVDRFHLGVAHGDFSNEDFCTKYWVPFLSASGRDGIVPGDMPEPEGRLKGLLVWVVEHLKYLVVIGLLLLLFPTAVARYCAQHPTGDLHWDKQAHIAFLNVAILDATARVRKCDAGFCTTFPSGWPPNVTIVEEQEDLKKLWACRPQQNISVAKPHGIQTLHELHKQFPQCFTLTNTGDAGVAIKVNRESGKIREVPIDSRTGYWLACDCDPSVDDRIREIRSGK